MSRAGRPLNLWVEEDVQDILRVKYRVLRTLASEQTDFQAVDVVETAGFGRMLLNDNNPMVSERDEFVYHEMIAHVPLFVHPGPRRVLVVGGGDGGTLREVLRHDSVEYCRLVEIDGRVVELCREYLPGIAAALDDPRAEVVIADAVGHVKRTEERFDVVLVDSTDPVGPGEALFGATFYHDVSRILADDGIVVSQAASPFYDAATQASLVATLGRIFPRVQLYNYSNLTYPGGLWSFSFATRGSLCPVGDLDPRRVAGAGMPLRYYNAAVHRSAFVHPEFQARQLAEHLTPLKSV